MYNRGQGQLPEPTLPISDTRWLNEEKLAEGSSRRRFNTGGVRCWCGHPSKRVHFQSSPPRFDPGVGGRFGASRTSRTSVSWSLSEKGRIALYDLPTLRRHSRSSLLDNEHKYGGERNANYRGHRTFESMRVLGDRRDTSLCMVGTGQRGGRQIFR